MQIKIQLELAESTVRMLGGLIDPQSVIENLPPSFLDDVARRVADILIDSGHLDKIVLQSAKGGNGERIVTVVESHPVL